MEDIYRFKIHDARAIWDGESLTVRLVYPNNREEIRERTPENLELGISVLERLLKEGESSLVDGNSYFPPAGGGSLYVTDDNKVLIHRRDKGARVHPMYHGAPGGFPESYEGVSTAEGIRGNAIREIGEECLIVTKDNPPWLIVPVETREYTEKAAENLGLDLKKKYVDVQTLPGKDTLEAVDEEGNLIFRTNTLLDMMFESSVSFDALYIQRLPLLSDEIVPIDSEGMPKDGRFIHFNREAYIIPISEVRSKRFGTPLEKFDVFQTRFENGLPKVYTPEYTPPFLGPEKVEVTHPHLWAPENHLTVCLDGLGIEGYKGRKLEIELWKTRCKLEGRSLLPEEVVDC